MPGHIIHLAAASRVLDEHPMNEQDAEAFLLGSIVPDMLERSNKKQSHFWSDEGFVKLERVPDLEAFYNKYGDKLSIPFILGYYGHLYMDALFMKTSWKTHFTFYDQDRKPNDLFDEVKYVGYRKDINQTIQIYPREEFFSNAYYYGDYDRVNPYIIKHYNVKIPKQPSITFSDVSEVVLEAYDERMAKLLAAANQFMMMPVDNVTYETTDNQLKVFMLSEFDYLIEETIQEILKRI